MAADAAMQVEESGDSAELTAINTEVQSLKDDIEFCEKMPPARRERHFASLGGHDVHLANLRASLQEWLAKQRACKPLRQQLASAQSREDHLTKTAKAEADKLQELREQLTELQEGIAAQQAKADKAATELVVAKALACKLAADWAAEAAGHTAQAQPPPAAAPAPQGFVSIDFAEAKWNEREAHFQQLLQQARSMVTASDMAEASEAAPSEVAASDLGDPADFDDDDKWTQVPKAKRRALLSRERTALASKVSVALGKVSTHQSPFAKK